MNSPFPGMDPYLESPSRWRAFHSWFIAEFGANLNAVLPPEFAAVIEDRLYVVPPGRNIYPDATIYNVKTPDVDRARNATVLERPTATPAESVTIWSETETEHFIEIRSLQFEEAVVAIVELLSPSNKTANSVGRREYLRKQEETLLSPVHLLEIDLLRGGEYTVAVPQESVTAYGDFDYIVSLHDADRPQDFSFWRCSVRHELPCVSIPLVGNLPAVIVDLQSVVRRTYDIGAFSRRIDYDTDALPPLNIADAQWANARLRDAGLRG